MTHARLHGWTGYDGKAPHKFYFAQFSDGPPARQAILLSDRESRSGRNKVLHYDFLASQEPWLIAGDALMPTDAGPCPQLRDGKGRQLQGMTVLSCDFCPPLQHD
ncbi:STY0301 family protein [Pseudoduganella sp. OTU4001]|uniref:STY0301 family protein n=1 Tax=Pseudoduganella sp. OTU4001 TaxID=3043854 RepID=UPI00406C9586